MNADETLRNAVVEFMHRTQRRSQSRGLDKDDISSGFTDIDYATGGFHYGECIVIGGMSSMGKTSLIINMVNSFLSNGLTCEYFTEESPQNIVTKIISQISTIKAAHLKKGMLKNLDWPLLAKAADELAKFSDNMDIKSIHNAGILNKRHDVVIIDSMESKELDPRELRKIYSDSLLILVCGVNGRDISRRPNKRPFYQDLTAKYESLQYISDYMFLLYRDEIFNSESEDKGIMEVILAKSKHSETDTFRLGFHPWIGGICCALNSAFNNILKDMVDPFFTSRDWQALRYSIIEKYGRLCMACGSSSDEIHVDHIKPRSKYPDLALDASNLQILCKACNLGKGADDETDWRKSDFSEPREAR